MSDSLVQEYQVFTNAIYLAHSALLDKQQDALNESEEAFKDGASNWGACFFARAYPELNLQVGQPEFMIADALGMGTNRVPMRIVYSLFDGLGKGRTMSKAELQSYIRAFLDDVQDPEMLRAINSLIDETRCGEYALNNKAVEFEQACQNG